MDETATMNVNLAGDDDGKLYTTGHASGLRRVALFDELELTPFLPRTDFLSGRELGAATFTEIDASERKSASVTPTPGTNENVTEMRKQMSRKFIRSQEKRHENFQTH